jgi:hypothetical protein
MATGESFFSRDSETATSILAHMRHFISDASSEVLSELKVVIVSSYLPCQMKWHYRPENLFGNCLPVKFRKLELRFKALFKMTC